MNAAAGGLACAQAGDACDVGTSYARLTTNTAGGTRIAVTGRSWRSGDECCVP